MQEIKVVLTLEKDGGKVKLLLNGKEIPAIKSFRLNFEENKIEMPGVRFKTDRSAHFFVDEKTKETALENINLLNYLNEDFSNFELVKDYQKAVDFDMKNIYMTSMHNAKKYIKERGCEN